MRVSPLLFLLAVSLQTAAQTGVDSANIILNRLANGGHLTCADDSDAARCHLFQEFSLRPPAVGRYALDIRNEATGFANGVLSIKKNGQ